jgi:hypothetical protein
MQQERVDLVWMMSSTEKGCFSKRNRICKNTGELEICCIKEKNLREVIASILASIGLEGAKVTGSRCFYTWIDMGF